MFSKKQWICAAVSVQCLSSIAFAQVSITTDNANPHASAMLEVKSADKGILIPRMTSAQRAAIANPATGLLVFDADLNQFYFYNGTAWGEIGARTPKFIADADANTSVHTETNANEDVIRFKIASVERWKMVGDRFENNSLNLVIGDRPSHANTTGYYNSFLGSYSGYSNTTGTMNSFFGSFSGIRNTTGYYNSFLGSHSGYFNITGYFNLFSGCYSGFSNTTGSLSTFLGYYASYNGNYSNAIAIGSYSVVSQDNEISIGNSSNTSAKIPVSWTVTSDARFKKDIQSNVSGLSFVRLLRPVTYHYDVSGLARHLREDERMDTATKTMHRVEPDSFIRASRAAKSKILQTGFLAQEVERAAQSIGYDFSGVDKPQNEGGVYGLRYAEFTVPLVKAVQELDAENQQLKSDVAVLKQQVAQLLKLVQTK